jgi:hypothetical protein
MIWNNIRSGNDKKIDRIRCSPDKRICRSIEREEREEKAVETSMTYSTIKIHSKSGNLFTIKNFHHDRFFDFAF